MTIRCDFRFHVCGSDTHSFASFACFGVRRRQKRGGKAYLSDQVFNRRRIHSNFTNASDSNQSLSQGIIICRYYTCTGAKDKILDHCFPRSSWPTTPVNGSVLQVQIRRAVRRPLTVHSCSDGIPCLVHQYTRIITESHHSTILPLQLLLHAHHNSVSDITAADFVGESGGTTCLGTGGPLLLDNDNYPITWSNDTVSLSLCSALIQGAPPSGN